MRKAKQPNIQTSQIIMSKMRKDLSLSNMPVGSVAVLSKNEFDTIKREAMMVGREEMTKSSKYENNIKQQEMEREMVRREHMKKLYEEKHKDMVELNEFELEEIENRDRLRRVKQQHEINQLDEVKYMDQMVAYAKAAYVRDIQVSEKKHIREMEIEEEKRKDVMMEIERLKGLEKDIKKEELRKSQQVQGKAVIVDQIKEREYQRMKAREEQGKEGQEMLKKIKMREEEEVKDLQAKKVHQSIVFNEMVISNEEQMKKKEEIKRKEKEETEKVMQYLLDKQKRDDEKREEMMRIKQEKEHEIQKLREAQEKASDRFQEVDNIRARRAVEKAERAARDKDRKEAEKKSRM